MKTRIYLLVTPVSVLLALAFSAFAQGGEDIPACSEEQMASVSAVSEEFITGFAPLYERLGPTQDDELPHLIADLDEFQQQWWTETAPSLPDCAEAVRMWLVAGRMVDEALIAMALAHGGDASRAESHIRQIAVLSEELTVLKGALPEVTEATPGIVKFAQLVSKYPVGCTPGVFCFEAPSGHKILAVILAEDPGDSGIDWLDARVYVVDGAGRRYQIDTAGKFGGEYVFMFAVRHPLPAISRCSGPINQRFVL